MQEETTFNEFSDFNMWSISFHLIRHMYRLADHPVSLKLKIK